MVSGGGGAPVRASLSERLRGMNFMKRREERVVRAGLTAAAEATAVAERWEGDGGEARDDALSAPLVVVEGGAGLSACAGSARAGRRSFGNFNKAVERDFAAAVVLARAFPNDETAAEAPGGAATAIEKDAAAQYQRWRVGNLTQGASKPGTAGGAPVKSIGKKPHTKKSMRTKIASLARNGVGPSTALSAGDREDDRDVSVINVDSDVGDDGTNVDVDDGWRDDHDSPMVNTSLAMKARRMIEKTKGSRSFRTSKASGVDGSRDRGARLFKKPKL
jgi:M-phase phosphoprotein 6